ncbi:MAG: transcription elongation factor NusA [Thaumarchaeota archaeon]|nr:transcription elongation factor NusA [Nitrososphaerota archaeon]
MKIPICTFDAKTGILCPKCESKLKAGHISKSDVEASMKLVNFVSKHPELDGLSLNRAYEVNGSTVLVLGSTIVSMRREPSWKRKLEEVFGKKVWLLEGDSSDRKILEDLLFPVKILTVNQVWLPDGSRLTKAIIPGRKTERFPVDLNEVKSVVKTVKGIDLLVEFERA